MDKQCRELRRKQLLLLLVILEHFILSKMKKDLNFCCFVFVCLFVFFFVFGFFFFFFFNIHHKYF